MTYGNSILVCVPGICLLATAGAAPDKLSKDLKKEKGAGAGWGTGSVWGTAAGWGRSVFANGSTAMWGSSAGWGSSNTQGSSAIWGTSAVWTSNNQPVGGTERTDQGRVTIASPLQKQKAPSGPQFAAVLTTAKQLRAAFL